MAETEKIGPYLLEKLLGQGGMGLVYRARHIRTGEHVALKTVKVPEEKVLTSMRREILALAALNHNGIIRIVDEGINEGVPWYAMELLAGPTLREWYLQQHWLVDVADTATMNLDARDPTLSLNTDLSKGHWWTQTVQEAFTAKTDPIYSARTRVDLIGWSDRAEHQVEPQAPTVKWSKEENVAGPTLSPGLKAVLLIIKQLCDTLAFLHGQGIIHRDLKPENIMIRDGRPVIVDFGLIHRFAGATGREFLDVVEQIQGTVWYIAPELLRGELVDARADLYALGCILYELLTGRPPFLGQTSREVLLSHMNDEPVPLSELVPDVPQLLHILVRRLLVKNPHDRLGYARDISLFLGRLGLDITVEGPDAQSYLYRPGLSGRDSVLSVLKGKLIALSNGSGDCILISGESGSGKTRLALELSQLAVRQGLSVQTGTHENLDRAPLQGLKKTLQAIADRCRSRGREETDRLLGVRAKVLAHYEPGFLELPGVAAMIEPVDLPPREARIRLFQALTETCFALAESSPFMIVLDDLQWADELTLNWLRDLVQTGKLCHHPILIIGLYRSDESNPLLADLNAEQNLTRIQLDRLDREGISVMVATMLALDKPPAAFISYLTHHSEGNPFFITEYMRLAVSEGLLWRDNQGYWHIAAEQIDPMIQADYQHVPLPNSLRELLTRRIRALSGPARRLVENASVLGRECSISLLQHLCDQDETVFYQAIEETRQREILLETSPGLVSFAHDKIRECSYEAISQPVGLHQAVAELLETLPIGHQARSNAQLAVQWHKAGNLAKASYYYPLAAKDAQKRYAYQEAEKLLLAYLELVPEISSDTWAVRFELIEVLRALGKLNEAIQQCEIALEQAHNLDDHQHYQQFLATLAIIHHSQGRLDESVQLQHQVLQLARTQQDQLAQAFCLGNLANLEHDLGHFDQARHLSQEALELLRQANHKLGEGMILANMANYLREQGQIQQARDLYEQALTIFINLDSQINLAITYCNLAVTYYDQADYQQAQTYYEKALVIIRTLKNREFEGRFLYNLAEVCLERGQVEQARTYYHQGLELTRAIGDLVWECGLNIGLAALIRLADHDLDTAENLVSQSLTQLRRLDHVLFIILALVEQGHLALAHLTPAHAIIIELEALKTRLESSSEMQSNRKIQRLKQAQTAFDSGSFDLLFKGQLKTDLPSWMQ
ncbi:tetratricopeptide repeat protein [bacterium]|nr:tetratricopeptide repeat protein [bacterium]